MDQNGQADPHNLESFRGYLTFLARLHLDPRLKNRLDSEDIVQETMLKAHKNIEQFKGRPGQFKGWLRTILLRTMLDEIGKLPPDEAQEKSSSRIGSLIPDDGTTPSEKAQKEEDAMRLEDALAKLPERQREVLQLRYFHGWAVKEICLHLKLSLPAVAGLLHNGVKNMRKHLEESE